MKILLHNYEMHVSISQLPKMQKNPQTKKFHTLCIAPTAILHRLVLSTALRLIRIAAQAFYNWPISAFKMQWKVWQERKVFIWYVSPFNISFFHLPFFNLKLATRIKEQIL